MIRWWFSVPWPFVTSFGIYLLSLIAVWQLVAHYYRTEWIRFAPEKARTVLREAHAALAESEIERQRLLKEVAELRGRIEGAKRRLRRSQDVRTVE